jgi:hypothetical protein
VQDRLQKDLADEKELRDLEKKRNDALEAVKLTQAKIIDDLDAQVQSKFPASFSACFLQFYAGFYLYRKATLLATETFLDSQPRAIEAVNATRTDDLPSPQQWNTEDHLTARSARVSYMDKLGRFLPAAAIRAFASLWPGETIPGRVENLAARIMDSGLRINEWRRSAARARADMSS